MQKKLSSNTLDNSQKKWSVGYVGEFAMKFLCMGKVLYSDLFWRKKNKILNCTIVSSSHCHSRQMVQSFLRSQTEHKKRAFQSQEVAITTSNTFLRRHLFSSTTCIRSGFCAATCKKRGLQIDFALILYHITEQSVFTFYYFDKSPDIEKIWNSSMKSHRQSLKFLDSKNSKDIPPPLYGIV